MTTSSQRLKLKQSSRAQNMQQWQQCNIERCCSCDTLIHHWGHHGWPPHWPNLSARKWTPSLSECLLHREEWHPALAKWRWLSKPRQKTMMSAAHSVSSAISLKTGIWNVVSTWQDLIHLWLVIYYIIILYKYIIDHMDHTYHTNNLIILSIPQPAYLVGLGLGQLNPW